MHQSRMRVQSVRFSEADWSDIQEEAAVHGMSASQFVREAALARVWWQRGRREHPGNDVMVQLLEVAHEREEL